MRTLGSTRCRGFTMVEILVVSGTIAVLMSLLLPAVQSAREAARRNECANNLRQCLIALNAYNLTHGVLPPGSVDPGRPIFNVPKGYHYGWIVQVLPYLDAEPYYDRFNFDLSVYHPHHLTVRLASLDVLICPSDRNQPPAGQPAYSSYAGCHHHDEAPIDITNNGMLFLNSAIKPEQLEDGFTFTLVIGEKTYEPGDLGWASGTRATLRNTGFGARAAKRGAGGGGVRFTMIDSNDPLAVGSFGSQHRVVNGGFADGSVRGGGSNWITYGARDKSKIELDAPGDSSF